MSLDIDLADLTLSHPHDFFRVKRLPIEPGTCFVLMPFAEEFTIVYETIKEALLGLMLCTRADDLLLGKSILERILSGIATSELIIADLTGQNPNVFYELAIAHARTKNVLLLSQNIRDVPFDLRSFFCHKYSLTSRAGLDDLKRRVEMAAREIAGRRTLKPLDNATTRTQRIVDYMRERLRHPEECRQLVIRVQATISSLGNVARLNVADKAAMNYQLLLAEERELLLGLVEKGARLYAILSPHMSVFSARELFEDRAERIGQLVTVLNNDHEAAHRCQVVLSPIRAPNLLFFGEDILFEGHKTALEKGFGLTLVYTDPLILRMRIGAYDSLFESAKAFTLERY